MSVKLPVITWRDAHGTVTARSLFGVPACAIDDDEAKALSQVKRYINWRVKRDFIYDLPKIDDVHLDYLAVSVRPVRELNKRTVVSAETISMRTIVVFGKRENGFYACSLPFFDAEFDCPNLDLVHRLAKEHIQSVMRAATSDDVVNRLLPNSINLTHVFVRQHIEERGFVEEDEMPPTLSEVATPIGRRLSKKEFSRAWQRDSDVRFLVDLIREENTNILLVGEGGIGKTTILVEAARAIEREKNNIPAWFGDFQKSNPRFWLTNGPRLIAGMQYLGQWEERCENVIDEISEIPGILCIEKAIDLIRYGGIDANSSIARFLIPFIANKQLRVITEATHSELQSIRRLLPGFDSLFQIVTIRRFNSDQAISVLKRIGEQVARDNKVEFEIATVNLTYRLFRRFMPYETFPGKCIAFWRSMLNSPQLLNENGTQRSVGTDQVIREFVELTGLPEELIRDEVPMSYADQVNRFRKQVIGQDHACETITSVITNFKAGLNDPNRPLGVMLFCGPTGVGKTELAKQLSNNLFGSGKGKDRMIRLDMSEYSVPGAAERLLIQNNGQPSPLVNKIREQPFCVLLLDEIEKSAHEVFDALMTVFDEGRLTDRLGRETIFKSAVIIMTSNLGVRTSSPIGFDSQQSDNYLKAVREFFRPEFFNRFDFVVPFQTLDQASILQIVVKELNALSKREGLEKRGIKLSWEKDVPAFIAELGYDRRYGARPIQRTIEQYVVKPIAHQLAQTTVTKSSRIHLRIENGDIRI